jgi:transcriptional regulator with XRE-family HTH domain
VVSTDYRMVGTRKPGRRTTALVLELTAERIRQKRTQLDVMRAMGFLGTQGETLGQIERGVISPSSEFLLAWAEALGRPLTLGPGAS